MISYKLQDLNFSDDINELVCEIDSKISSIAKNKLHSIKYGAEICNQHDEYFVLNKYRKILVAKAKNSTCLSAYLIDDIISVIKQYLYSGKVQRF